MNNRRKHRRLLLAAGWMILLVPAASGQVDHYLAGRACLVQERFDSAAYHLELALREKPGDAVILRQLGAAHYASSNYLAARDAFFEAERLVQGSVSLELARTEAMLNHTEQALKYLREHLSSRQRVNEEELLLDEAIQKLEGRSGWRQLWNEKEWYSQDDQDFQEALFLARTGNGLEAINILNGLEKKGYRKSEVLSSKAGIFLTLGNRKAARSAYEEALRSDVRNLDALMELSRILVEDGDSKSALPGLDRLIRQSPERFDAYLLRAQARSSAGDLPGAVADMDLYLTYFPDDNSAIHRKGMIQFSHGKYLDAIQSFNRALELDTGNADYYLARGRAYAATGTHRYADRDMSMALDLDPFNGETWYEKGLLLEKMGNRPGACRCYRKAFQYGVFEAGERMERNCR